MSDPVPLGRMYASTFARFADRPAVRDDRGELTYAALGIQVRRLASALRRLGLRRGDRVVVVSPNSSEWVQVDVAAALGGVVRVGLLPRLHAEELRAIAADAAPAVVFADADGLTRRGRAWIPDEVGTVVALGPGPVPEGVIGFDDLVVSGADEEAPLPDGDDLAALLYTSGSTGRPKGVKVTHANAGARIQGIRAVLPAPGASGVDAVALHTAPISHFSGGLLEAVAAGGGLNTLAPTFDAARVADRASSGEITVLPLVPTMISMVVDELDRRAAPTGRVGAVTTVPYAGSAIPPDRAARAHLWFGDAMVQLYGASEAQMPISALAPADHVADTNARGLPRLASAGRPRVEVAIVDEDHRPVPSGEAGEIATRGPHVGPGYWCDQEATAETFRDGWCYTGDVGYLDEFGYLFLLDRRKDMIITGGFNVYPREIENVVSAVPGVRGVAVLGGPDERWGEAVTAFVALAPGLTTDSVIEHCRGRLGGYKVPKRVIVVDELPTRGTGKIDKVALRERLWAGRERRV